MGPSKNCAVEDTIKYTGDEKNCQIQIERAQQDEDGNWQVQNYHTYINMCTFFEKIVRFGYVVQNML